MKRILAIVFVVSCVATLVQAGDVHYKFVETSSGTWEVSVEVTGSDTAGLATYDFWVRDTTGVEYVENTLFDEGDDEDDKGFDPSFLLAEYDGVDFWVDNAQDIDYLITGIGKDDVIQGPVDLDVPALLGTLSTPAGLDEDDFEVNFTALLNASGDGFLSDTNVNITYAATPIPEPLTLSLLGIGGAVIAIKRKRR